MSTKIITIKQHKILLENIILIDFGYRNSKRHE